MHPMLEQAFARISGRRAAAEPAGDDSRLDRLVARERGHRTAAVLGQLSGGTTAELPCTPLYDPSVYAETPDTPQA